MSRRSETLRRKRPHARWRRTRMPPTESRVTANPACVTLILPSRSHANARLPRQPSAPEAGRRFRPPLDRQRVGTRLPGDRAGMRIARFWVRLATTFAAITATALYAAANHSEPVELAAVTLTAVL